MAFVTITQMLPHLIKEVQDLTVTTYSVPANQRWICNGYEIEQVEKLKNPDDTYRYLITCNELHIKVQSLDELFEIQTFMILPINLF